MIAFVNYIAIFTGLLLASVHDIKTREVPDYLSYFLIALGFFFQFEKLLLTSDITTFLFSMSYFALALCFGFLMYRMKQWGGADAKLLAGLSLLLGRNENYDFLIFFFNFLWVGAVYGLIGTTVLIFSKLKTFIKIFKKDYQKNKFRIFVSLALIIFGALASVVNIFLLMVVITGLLWLLFIIFSSANELMVKKISINKLTEGDWIKEKVVHNGKVLFNPEKNVCVSAEQIKTLKQEGITEIKIVEGIPFVPAFLLSFLVTILTPYLILGLFTRSLL